MQQRKYVFTIGACLLAVVLAGCGGYNGPNPNPSPSPTPSPTPSTPVTGLKKRVLVTNSEPSLATNSSPGLTLFDAQKDVLAKSVSTVAFGKMLTASGMTVLQNIGTNQVSIFTNSTESISSTASLLGPPTDVAISTDGKTAYAAVREAGSIEVITTATGAIPATVVMPSVARLVEGPGEHMLLAFADDPQALTQNPNSFAVINTNGNAVVFIQEPPGSQPYSAVFDPSDATDSTAFILNCGSGCGGVDASSKPVAPSVVKVNFSGVFSTPPTPATFSTPIAVSAATVGLLSGSNLFVAGTPPGSSSGTLQSIDTGSSTVTSPVSITNGLHTLMAMSSNNRLYVGASNCTASLVDPQNNLVAGCLSIFDTGSQTVTIPSESGFRLNFNVTGLQQISNRNVMYVCQGGALDFFDITTNAPSTTITLVDIVGNAMSVIQIDP